MQKRISVNDIGYLFCKCIGLFYGSRFTILYFLSTSVTYYLHMHPFRLEENKFVLAHIGGISFVCKFFFAYYVNG